MKLEDQVCTLEQSIRLKELGVKQQSLACYIGNELEFFIKPFYDWAEQKGMNALAAFTVAELGLLLPKGLGGNDGHNWSFYHRHCWKGESVGYSAHGTPSIEQPWYKTEAESRADMLIQLLESGRITAEHCNELLKNQRP